MKRLLSLLLAVLMIIAYVPTTFITVNSVSTATNNSLVESESASFISRSDGVWLWPVDVYAISDWAGCNAYNSPTECYLCKRYNGTVHMVTCEADHRYPTYGHNGFDIPVSYQNVYAMADGRVISCSYEDSRGYYIVIEHPAGKDSTGREWSYYSYYQHLNSFTVSVGSDVKVRDVIAQSGNSGYSTGPHLHVGLLLGHKGITNPVGVLEGGGDWVITPGFQEGRILNNPALNSPAGKPADPHQCGDNLVLHAGSVMYTLNAAEVSIGEKPAECNHSYSLAETPASCTQDGLREYSCSACGDTYSETIEALGHNHVGIKTEATCAIAAHTTYTCRVCGDSYVEYADDWSKWSEEYPTDVSAELIEQKTQYSTMGKQYTTSSSDTLDGWTKCGTAYGDWGAVQTTTAKPTESDILRITNTVQTGWGYYHWCNYYYNGGNNWNVDSVEYGSPCYWHSYTFGFELPAVSFPDKGGQQAYGGDGSGAAPCPYNFYIWFRDTGADVYTYSYQTRDMVNQFYRWDDEWSDWTDEEIVSNEDFQVKTRTLYRYKTSELKDHEYIRTEQTPTFTEKGFIAYTCINCGDTVTEEIPCLVGKVAQWNIALADDLLVNFYLQISEDIESTAKVRIYVGEKGYTFPVANLEKTEDGLYIARVSAAAAQMNDFIYVSVINNGMYAETAVYTIRQYADTILADESYSEYHAVVREMLHYGAAAQTYFDYEADNLANSGITGAGSVEIPDSVDNTMSVSGNAKGISFYGASLIFRDRIAVRYYFSFEGQIKNMKFMVNGRQYAPQLKDGLYYIEIADILPQNLDQPINLSVTDANGDILSVSYNPMSYIVRMNEKGSDALKALVKALYNYHLAAKALNV